MNMYTHTQKISSQSETHSLYDLWLIFTAVSCGPGDTVAWGPSCFLTLGQFSQKLFIPVILHAAALLFSEAARVGGKRKRERDASLIALVCWLYILCSLMGGAVMLLSIHVNV